MKEATLFLLLVGGALALVEGVAPRACSNGSCGLLVLPRAHDGMGGEADFVSLEQAPDGRRGPDERGLEVFLGFRKADRVFLEVRQ
jgi:hypothetical protein